MSHLTNLHYALGKPVSIAVIRSSPEDFIVNEQLSFEPDGNGQHVYLRVQKTNLTTQEVANLLAKFVDVKLVAIGYAGLKDKHAVTVQWFSVDLAGKPEPDWGDLQTENLKVIEVVRHSRKLKRGSIAQNQFEIVLREFTGDKSELERRLDKIKQSGVPNYYGEQRFGTNDFNLKKAEQLLLKNKKIKRHHRSIYLSAVRSFLFNQVLSRRVAQDIWGKAVDGDVFMLEGTRSIFTVDSIDNEIIQRISTGDIHPTGPMWGCGELLTKSDALDIEEQVVSDYPQWCSLLEGYDLKQERRALRLAVRDLAWDSQNDVVLKFALSAGSYATVVLRELLS